MKRRMALAIPAETEPCTFNRQQFLHGAVPLTLGYLASPRAMRIEACQ